MAVLFKMQRERKVRRRMEAEMKMEGPSRQRGSLAFFEAVLACCVATGRCRAGFRLQAEQVAQPDAGHRIAFSCSVCGAG